MSAFRYQAIEGSGAPVRGLIEAGDRREVDRLEGVADQRRRRAVLAEQRPDRQLRVALADDPVARAFFDGLSYSHQLAYVSWI